MKRLGLALMVLGLCGLPAFSYTDNVGYSYFSVNLTSTSGGGGTGSISGAGTINSLACVNTSTITGSPNAFFTLVTGTLLVSQYSMFYNAPTPAYPMYVQDVNDGHFSSEKYVVPLNVPYTNGFVLSIAVATAASAGGMNCSVHYTPA